MSERIDSEVWWYGDGRWWIGYLRAWNLSPVDDGRALIETKDGFLIEVAIGNLKFSLDDPNVS